MHTIHQHPHHLLFFAVILVLLVVVLVSHQVGVAQEQDTTGMTIKSGTVCCTFMLYGSERTCVAPEGQSCTSCKEVCESTP